ncbi:hypothetical protein HK102_002042 [Quaeritorhiza haematococci]|nr:hypothetical protein HK102_002042 [Quaeritorhiza haematococci]
MPELLEAVKNMPEKHVPYIESRFKFTVQSFNRSIPMPEQVSKINSFRFLPFEGGIDLKNPEVTFMYYEEYAGFAGAGGDSSFNENGSEEVLSEEKPTGNGEEKTEIVPLLKKCWFGVLAGFGNRNLLKKFDLKKRVYLGITSMDAELSLVMANQCLAQPGSFILDPFVGTGNKNIESNVMQYGLRGRVVGNIICDIAHHPWRYQELWDAIVCDPPYGVRAGAKKIGSNPKIKPPPTQFKSNGDPRYPQTVPYEMHQVLVDLLDFAACHLVSGGRLVYWLPTVSDEYSPEDVPTHPQFKLISNSEQNFGKWARRLITMEKLKSPVASNFQASTTSDSATARKEDSSQPDGVSELIAATKSIEIQSGGDEVGSEQSPEETAGRVPAHSYFRERYFTKPSKGSD